jgi:multiple sugar transport system ATP-binding protein
MRNGAIEQCDKPTVVYDLPSTEFVGGFIGNPPMNFLDARVQRPAGGNGSEGVEVVIGDFRLSPHRAMQPLLAPYAGRPIVLGIRAENMEALTEPVAGGLRVSVLVVEPLGAQNLLTVKIGANMVKISTHPTFAVAPDQDIWLRFPADKIRWIEHDTGRVLYPDGT